MDDKKAQKGGSLILRHSVSSHELLAAAVRATHHSSPLGMQLYISNGRKSMDLLLKRCVLISLASILRYHVRFLKLKEDDNIYHFSHKKLPSKANLQLDVLTQLSYQSHFRPGPTVVSQATPCASLQRVQLVRLDQQFVNTLSTAARLAARRDNLEKVTKCESAQLDALQYYYLRATKNPGGHDTSQENLHLAKYIIMIMITANKLQQFCAQNRNISQWGPDMRLYLRVKPLVVLGVQSRKRSSHGGCIWPTRPDQV